MPPEQITLRDIICVIEGEDSQSPSPPSTNNPASHVLFGVWQEIAQAEKELLTSQTFGQLADKTKQQADSMYYI